MQSLGQRSVDAVISDIEMPRINGLELTQWIRSEESLKHTPVVLVTSLTSDEDRKRGLEVGANAYIAKSAFKQDALLGTLERLIGR